MYSIYMHHIHGIEVIPPVLHSLAAHALSVLVAVSPFAGAISTAVLPIRNIIQLHDMLVNVLTLVKHTCDRLLSEHHWEEFVGEEEVSH